MGEYDESTLELASVASQRIFKFHYNREFTGTKPTPPTGRLFHYTNADGLKGIIEQNEIWATSAYYLNDSDEITYGYGVLKQALGEWVDKNPRSEPSLSLGLARDFQRYYGETLLKKDIIKPIYLACFCEDDNLLSQWRSYGQSGGYSLGFKVPSDATGRGFRPEPNVYTASWVKVEYDRDEQVKKCRAILDTILPIFDDPQTAQAVTAVGAHPFLGYGAIRKVIADILLEETVGFKNDAFEVEKEWRIIVRQRELVKQGTDDGGKTKVPVYFRSLRGLLVPFIKLLPTKAAERLPLACVRSGPTLEKTTAGTVLRMLLDNNGFPSVLVKASDISLRFLHSS
jgi:hypothetical protein